MDLPVVNESFIDIEEQGGSIDTEDVSMSEVYASGNHFIDKLAVELDIIKQKHTHVEQFFSNSPLTIIPSWYIIIDFFHDYWS